MLGSDLQEREILAKTDKQLAKKVEIWAKTGWVTEQDYAKTKQIESKLALTEAILDKKDLELQSAAAENERLQKLLAELTEGAEKAKTPVKKGKDITPEITE